MRFNTFAKYEKLKYKNHNNILKNNYFCSIFAAASIQPNKLKLICFAIITSRSFLCIFAYFSYQNASLNPLILCLLLHYKMFCNNLKQRKTWKKRGVY